MLVQAEKRIDRAMTRRGSSYRGEGVRAAYARVALLALLGMLSLFANREARADSAMVVAAGVTANAGLAACSNNSGKALYDCVANVLTA